MIVSISVNGIVVSLDTHVCWNFLKLLSDTKRNDVTLIIPINGFGVVSVQGLITVIL